MKSISSLFFESHHLKRKLKNSIEFLRLYGYPVFDEKTMGNRYIGDKRFCHNCKNPDTFIEKSGKEQWYNHNGNWYCNNCNNRLFKNPKWNAINKPQLINYKGTQFKVGFKPRKGICSKCGAKVGIDCKKTCLHHIKYHDDDILKDTIELCVACHRKTHARK
jgi:hypothetical protein